MDYLGISVVAGPLGFPAGPVRLIGGPLDGAVHDSAQDSAFIIRRTDAGFVHIYARDPGNPAVARHRDSWRAIRATPPA